ncbi:hypothetical protein [Parasitella parasitica]|uniref:Uncharacterized protein n=1 Tax=Parasitella parasitica TaxID=35722 RepID=A0A0B7MZ89_9FUNG|nr:hypothetical protein [Parasitella parasitica]
MFHGNTDFKKLRLNMDDLTPNGNNKILFENMLNSDGFSVDLLFYRRKRKKNESDVVLNLGDFSHEEVVADYQPISFDPGRKSLFTAVVGLEFTKQIRKSSTKEYHHLTEILLDVISNYIKAGKGAPEIVVNMLTHGYCQVQQIEEEEKTKEKFQARRKDEEEEVHYI